MFWLGWGKESFTLGDSIVSKAIFPPRNRRNSVTYIFLCLTGTWKHHCPSPEGRVILQYFITSLLEGSKAMFLGPWPFSRLLSWFAISSRLSGQHGLTSSKFLRCLCLLLLLPLIRWGQALPYKIGVIGPWTCDPFFSKALPEVAAALAIERISRDASFDRTYSFTYVILNEDCQTSKALASFISHQQMASGFVGPANPGYCEAASLLGNSWDKGIFSWACVNPELDNKHSYPTFSRTLPSPIRVLVTVMKYFQWAHAGVISSDEDIWVHTANRVSSALRSHGLPVGVVLTSGQDSQSIQKALQQIRQADRIRSECLLLAKV